MQNQPGLLDRSWAWLTMALVGEELDLDDDICGAVVSVKPKMERIQLWIRDRGDGPGGFEKVNGIGKRMMKVLELSKQDGITFDFQVKLVDRCRIEIPFVYICLPFHPVQPRKPTTRSQVHLHRVSLLSCFNQPIHTHCRTTAQWYTPSPAWNSRPPDERR